LTVGAGTHAGLKRPYNEDRYRVNVETGLFLVVDGVGGQIAGQAASESVATAIDAFILETSSNHQLAGALCTDPTLSITGNRIRAATLEAHQALSEDIRAQPALRGMAATMAVAQLSGTRVAVTNLGDCRVYLFRQGVLTQITNDHSWVAEQVRSGALNADAARVHPKRNIVTRALNGEDPPDIDVVEFDLTDGDSLLLCTDGLHGPVTDDEMRTVLNDGSTDPQEMCERLIVKANERGGRDNVTVIIVRMPEGAGSGGSDGLA
jgi:protein phosphatase